MRGLEVVVLLGVAVIALSLLARRLHMAPPLLLLVGGLGIGFLPRVGGVDLPPEVVLFLFLPALLYWESLTTSLREIRANLRVIVLYATALVIATAALVALVGHAVLGLAWPMAWVLGAVVAPTDATAVGAVAGSLPRRPLTILRAESLVNDGTALTVYGIAVGAARTHHAAAPLAVGWRFVSAYAGGVLVGLLVAVAVTWARKRVGDPRLEQVLSVLTAFTAYLLAELAGVSGVVAVVSCGLLLAHLAPVVASAQFRTQTGPVWELATYLLNGALFVLVGLQVRPVLGGLDSVGLGRAALDALLVAGVVIGTRLVWANTTPYLVRALDRRPAQRARRVGWRGRLPTAWAGFRGAVSLAAALAVPATDAGGAPLAGRDLVLTVTFGVILVTLLVQGLTMPLVVRFARLPPDPGVASEERLAERVAVRAGYDAIDARAAGLGIDGVVPDRVRRDYAIRLKSLVDAADDPRLASVSASKRALLEDERRLRLSLIGEKRAALLRLRDSRDIDDAVMRRVQAVIDSEEVRLSGEVGAE